MRVIPVGSKTPLDDFLYKKKRTQYGSTFGEQDVVGTTSRGGVHHFVAYAGLHEVRKQARRREYLSLTGT